MRSSNVTTFLSPVLAVVVATTAAPSRAETAKPEGPAAQQFAAWLAAFDKGDRAGLLAYHQQSFSYTAASPGVGDIDREVGLFSVTGGFELEKSESTSPTRYSAVLKERRSRQFAHATIEVDAVAPHRVVSFDVHPIDTPDEFLTAEERRSGGGPIDGPRRRALLDKIAHELAASYVFPDVARRMIASVREHAAHGAYEKMTNGSAFALAITQDLQQVSHDRHLRIIHQPPRKAQPSKPDFRAMSYGFGPIERLPGNVAHVVINGFWDVDDVRDGVADAMSGVADADALILDLRGNHGGNAQTVVLVASYLFDDKPVHLEDLVFRDGERNSLRTNPEVKGRRFGGKKPLYILTSAQTISGGEALAYDLQSLHRATLIGEKTAGAAHPTQQRALDSWFVMFVPDTRSVNPITKTSWEGVGVRPDVAVSADAALDEALRRARQALTSDHAAGEKSSR